MNIQSISYASNNGASFRGLWGNPKYSHHTNDNKYMCDHYVKPYYPFADETEEEIAANMKKHLDKIHAEEDYGKAFDYTVKCEHTFGEVKPRLSFSSKDYKALLKGFMPECLEQNETLLRKIAEITKLLK